MNEALIAILGVVVGIMATQITHQRDRADKYRLAILKERFEVAQQAFMHAIRMKEHIHGDANLRIKAISEIRQWFNSCNLYMPPDIRNDFDATLQKLDTYQITLEAYYEYKKNNDEENANKEKDEYLSKFKEIQTLNKRIQDSVNVYFDPRKYS